MRPTLDLLQLDAQLEQLLELTTTERQERLATLAIDDPLQAKALQRLLELAGEAPTTDLQNAAAAVDPAQAQAPAPQIPGYQIEYTIGQGGMAMVYAGRRLLGDIEQLVAIKVLRAAVPAAVDRARFLTEQQILARLNHPHIATLLDLGVVDERPYMVLERIAGVPVDQWLHPGVAAVTAVLDVLEQICDALSLAHAHLVVHRDIKPANVLVSQSGHIKLIDFGIAKLLEDTSSGRYERTLDGSAPLTLRYASPEQLRGDAVGVASDVYQVGLLAYWLLCGLWPFGDGRDDAVLERLDPQARPVPPSRRANTRQRSRALQGDLDAILLKCLRYAPHERYLSIAELRADLHRHRRHQAVLARPHTRGYLLHSWLRRHRLGASVAALLLLLGAGASVFAWSLATRNAEHAQRMEQVVETIAGMLTRANPYEDRPGTVSVTTVVDAASNQFLKSEPADPVFHLRMLELLAALQQDLLNPALQAQLLERAAVLARQSGVAKRTRARLRADAIEAQARAGDLDGALAAIEAYRLEFPGPEPLPVLVARSIVYSDRGDFARAEADLQEAAAQLQQSAVDPLQHYDILAGQVIVLARGGKIEEALAAEAKAGLLLDQTKPTHRPAWLRHRAQYATLQGQLGNYAQGAVALLALHDEARAQLGAGHPRVLELAANAAVMLLESAQPSKAWALLQPLGGAELAEMPKLSLAAIQITRGAAALFSGQPQAALTDVLDSLDTAIGMLGPQSPRLAYFLERAAWTLFELEQVDLAVEFAHHAWRLSGQTRTAVDFLLQLAAQTRPVEGRPDPAFESRISYECDRLEFGLLSALWTGQPMPPEFQQAAVPSDCAAISGMRLSALGLKWQPGPGISPQFERMDTPLLRRWLSAPAQRVDRMQLSAAQLEKAQALLARLAQDSPTDPQ